METEYNTGQKVYAVSLLQTNGDEKKGYKYKHQKH